MPGVRILQQVSIRFEVRGASRPVHRAAGHIRLVSIRFEVRGASRHEGTLPITRPLEFQSASRFAVLPDSSVLPGRRRHLGFNPLRGSRCFQTLPHDTLSRQALLPRSYTPPLLTPSEQRTESVLNGVKPLVKWHTHLRLFLVVLQPPLSEGVSKMPGRRELGVFVGFYLGPGPVPRRGIRPRARSGLLFGRR